MPPPCPPSLRWVEAGPRPGYARPRGTGEPGRPVSPPSGEPGRGGAPQLRPPFPSINPYRNNLVCGLVLRVAGLEGREHVLSTTAPTSNLILSVALDGAGWHPAAWREPRARPAELLTGRYWADLATEAEPGLLDFLPSEDGLSLQSSRFRAPDSRTDQVRGQLDSVLIAARVAPLTRHVGLIPTVIVTHTEPFHASKAIATLDYVSGGRAGVRVRVSTAPHEAAHFGRRSFPQL